jgi:hypothetical protein
MIYRNLRIAWSAVCGILCLLLIALWVRGYWHTDSLTKVGSDLILNRIGSESGILFLGWSDYKTTPNIPAPDETDGWEYQEYDVEPHGTAAAWMFKWSVSESFVVLPTWFVTLLLVVLAAAQWLPWRFSLRTLLIAMTLIAAGLGLIVVFK